MNSTLGKLDKWARVRTGERREGGKCGWEKKGDHKEPLQLAGDGELEDADMHTNTIRQITIYYHVYV